MHVAKTRQTRPEGGRVRLEYPIELSIGKKIQGVDPTAHAAPAYVPVLQMGYFCLTVLFHMMISAMGWPMQMGRIGDLKDASGTILDIRISNATSKRRVVRWPGVLLMVEHTDHATVRCTIPCAKRSEMHERTM